MGLLIRLEDFDNFKDTRDYPAEDILPAVLDQIRGLDEREELEPYIRSILADTNDTPHGPAEIVDILTHKVVVNKEGGMAAFVLKGKSFPTVRHHQVAHQIYRLEKIAGLRFAVFAAAGTVLDAAKEQFCATAERLNCRYAILDAMDLARLFVAYGFLCPRDGEKIVAGRCKCGYSPKRRIFNVLQKESLTALAGAHKLEHSAGLIILPTGSGKTRIAAEDAKEFDAECVLYVAHTQEILDVAQSELEAVFGTKNVTRHTSSSTLHRLNRVNITTIQLLRQNLEKIQPKSFDYLVVDEFHHAAAKSYRDLISWAQVRFLLGLTATPFRGDRQDIAALCDQNVLVEFELRSGIDLGVLSPYHYFGCFDDIDYSKIQYDGGRYDIRDLERALIIPERDAAVIQKWREHAEEKPTLAFCCSHRHAKRVSEAFNEAGIAADFYVSSTKIADRKALAGRFQSGDLKILCVVDVMNEGIDLPFVECLLFLRPTESKRIFYQQLGRGLRKYVGKSHCVVIDFIGNFKNAFRLVEYQSLLPHITDKPMATAAAIGNSKQILNLPLGCEVHFDDRVIDIFARQALDPRYATRHNIGKILVYQYLRLGARLGRNPTKRDVDRNLLLASELYILMFGSWQNFERIMGVDEQRLAIGVAQAVH
jgi:superfamily II DNA or RNA helicase